MLYIVLFYIAVILVGVSLCFYNLDAQFFTLQVFVVMQSLITFCVFTVILLAYRSECY